MARFHDAAAAERAQGEFIARFQGRGVPEKIDTVQLTLDGAPLRVANVLKSAGLVASTSEANRLIDQGGVRLGTDAASLAKLTSRDTDAHARPLPAAGRQAALRLGGDHLKTIGGSGGAAPPESASCGFLT